MDKNPAFIEVYKKDQNGAPLGKGTLIPVNGRTVRFKSTWQTFDGSGGWSDRITHILPYAWERYSLDDRALSLKASVLNKKKERIFITVAHRAFG
jgi:hypothetical protein